MNPFKKLFNYISGNYWKVKSEYSVGIYKFGVYHPTKFHKWHYPYYSSQEAQIECDRLNNGGAIEYN